ncbi:MAG: translocation/assembly module TamB domain-containing protein [Chlamydiota bacterium]
MTEKFSNKNAKKGDFSKQSELRKVSIMWKWLRALIWSCITLLFISSLFLAGVQTNYAKEKLKAWLIHAAEQEGMELSIGTISGAPPLRLTFENVVFKPTKTDTIEIPELRFSIAFFPLFTKNLQFKRILIRDGSYTFSETRGFFLPHLDLPFNISIKQLLISLAHIKNLETNTEAVYTLHAEAQLKSHETGCFLKAKISSPSHSETSGKVYLLGNKKRNFFKGKCAFNLSTMQVFSPLFVPPFEANCFIRVNINGTWRCKPCKGNVHMKLRYLSAPEIDPLDQLSLIDLSFAIKENGDIACTPFTIKNDFLESHVTALLSDNYTLKTAEASLFIKTLSPFNKKLSGSLNVEGLYDLSHALLEISTKGMCVDHHCIETCTTKIQAFAENNGWKGVANMTLSQEDLNLQGKALFHYKDNLFDFQELLLKGQDILVSGDLKVALSPLALDGGLYAYIQNLNRFSRWAKDEHLGGSLALSTRFKSDTFSECTLTIKNLDCSELLASELRAEAKMYNLWTNPQGSFSFEGERIYLPNVFLKTLSLHAVSTQESWQFALDGEGLWKDPLSFSITGAIKEKEKTLELIFEHAKAYTLGNVIQLESPFTLSKNDQEIKLTPCAFKIGEGSFFSEGYLSKKHSKLILKTDHFPLELLSLSRAEFATMGTCSLDAHISEEQCSTQGRLSLLLEQASILPSGKAEPLLAKGNLQLNLDQNVLQIHSGLKASGSQFFEWTATLPVKGCFFPFTLDLERDSPIASEIVVEGNLEEIFDFINVGSHKFSGLASCHLYLSKTLNHPSLIGRIDLQEGSYENYITGTALESISASMAAENNRVLLTHFSAEDHEKGRISVTGELLLQTKEKFPFKFCSEFDNLNMLNYDSFSSNFTGPIIIEGNTEQGKAMGTLIVSHANFYIPDELPPDIPVLPITYIHEPPHMKKNRIEPPTLFPIALDIQLSAKNQIFVRGRGLSSEWQGNVHLGGKNSNVAANGTLHLVKGEFVFSGKIFTLTQGEISFAHKNAQEAFLSLTGTLALSDATITAILRGPLSTPQIAFQSIPHMPTSSILARILFNKDISDISPMQAIQLAQAIVTLSGGAGPDVLEKIRKSLGIDRLNIVSANGSDDISVQIGKYLTRGVMITLSQSADSSQILVEVDLSKGFIFQAETQEEDEGKFTLKWNRNY